MDLSFLKNPIILAIIATVITYLYMYWENQKKKDENPKVDIEPVSYITPAIVGLLTLFITYNFLSTSEPDASVTAVLEQSKEIQPSVNLLGGGSGSGIINKSRISERLTDSFGSNTFHLIGKNAIRLPPTDVFIDIAKF